jgi:hypothetical protein
MNSSGLVGCVALGAANAEAAHVPRIKAAITRVEFTIQLNLDSPREFLPTNVDDNFV